MTAKALASQASISRPSDIERRRAEGLARVARLLDTLQKSSHFGKLVIDLQNGVVTMVRTEQVMKIEEL